jgi:hypothetical protein
MPQAERAARPASFGRYEVRFTPLGSDGFSKKTGKKKKKGEKDYTTPYKHSSSSTNTSSSPKHYSTHEHTNSIN